MTQRERRFTTTSALLVAAFAACTTANPNYHKPHNDAGADGAGGNCESGAALRCDGTNLIRCNADGTGEVSEPCSPLGCNAAKLSCATDIDPSNGLAPFLDLSKNERDFDLGASATIDTDTGEVKVAGAPVVVHSETLAQDKAPIIRVFIVKSLTTGDVDIVGKNAIAIVSNSDIKIGGVFTTISDWTRSSAPGMYNDGSCMGHAGGGDLGSLYRLGGSGGGGFGSPGGRGGSATMSAGTADGGLGGTITGNATLIPLRGGCGSSFSAGGAIQLVSRTRIMITGAVAANGAGSITIGGGGSGGGILLESPTVELESTGKMVANGGGGFCFPDIPQQTYGKGGGLDATPARGGQPCNGLASGGTGAAGNTEATNGDADNRPTNSYAVGGGGGGGGGRIRINTLPLGFHTMGLLSPNPSPGPLGTR